MCLFVWCMIVKVTCVHIPISIIMSLAAESKVTRVSWCMSMVTCRLQERHSGMHLVLRMKLLNHSTESVVLSHLICCVSCVARWMTPWWNNIPGCSFQWRRRIYWFTWLALLYRDLLAQNHRQCIRYTLKVVLFDTKDQNGEFCPFILFLKHGNQTWWRRMIYKCVVFWHKFCMHYLFGGRMERDVNWRGYVQKGTSPNAKRHQSPEYGVAPNVL